MDAGRRFAIETFGAHGPEIRDKVPQLAREEHEAMADAQDASGHRDVAVYGQFWRGMLERFEQFGTLPGAALVRPGQAPYKVPVINHVALMAWRYGAGSDKGALDKRFFTSEARVRLTNLDPGAVQEELNLGIPKGLSGEEASLAITAEQVLREQMVRKLVVVTIGSAPSGLYDITWGQVAAGADQHLTWAGFNESLLSLASSSNGLAEVGRTFTDGELPERELHLHQDAGRDEPYVAGPTPSRDA